MRGLVRNVVVVVTAMLSLGMFTGAAQAAYPNLFWWGPTGLDSAQGGITENAIACPSASQCSEIDQAGRELTFNPTSPLPSSSYQVSLIR